MPRLEGSKAPIPSFPGSTFPTEVQGMVLEATVDPNVLSYSVPIIVRGWEEVDRRDEASPWISDEAESIPKPLGEVELALIPQERPSLALGGRARRNLSLSPRTRQSWPFSLDRDRAQPSGVGRGRAGPYPSSGTEPSPWGLGEAESSP